MATATASLILSFADKYKDLLLHLGRQDWGLTDLVSVGTACSTLFPRASHLRFTLTKGQPELLNFVNRAEIVELKIYDVHSLVREKLVPFFSSEGGFPRLQQLHLPLMGISKFLLVSEALAAPGAVPELRRVRWHVLRDSPGTCAKALTALSKVCSRAKKFEKLELYGASWQSFDSSRAASLSVQGLRDLLALVSEYLPLHAISCSTGTIFHSCPTELLLRGEDGVAEFSSVYARCLPDSSEQPALDDSACHLLARRLSSSDARSTAFFSWAVPRVTEVLERVSLLDLLREGKKRSFFSRISLLKMLTTPWVHEFFPGVAEFVKRFLGSGVELSILIDMTLDLLYFPSELESLIAVLWYLPSIDWEELKIASLFNKTGLFDALDVKAEGCLDRLVLDPNFDLLALCSARPALVTIALLHKLSAVTVIPNVPFILMEALHERHPRGVPIDPDSKDLAMSIAMLVLSNTRMAKLFGLVFSDGPDWILPADGSSTGPKRFKQTEQELVLETIRNADVFIKAYKLKFCLDELSRSAADEKASYFLWAVFLRRNVNRLRNETLHLALELFPVRSQAILARLEAEQASSNWALKDKKRMDTLLAFLRANSQM